MLLCGAKKEHASSRNAGVSNTLNLIERPPLRQAKARFTLGWLQDSRSVSKVRAR